MAFSKPTLRELERRYKYHPPTGRQTERYAAIWAAILATAVECVELTPTSREQDRALDALDHAMFLFNAAIARTEA